jgi:hypothetical protein
VNELYWVGLAVLVVVAGLLARRGERKNALTDDLVRQIEKTGRIDREDVEPLDIRDIREQEDDFWAQSWDRPESLGDPLGWEKSDDP